jgi:hypothetical protein
MSFYSPPVTNTDGEGYLTMSLIQIGLVDTTKTLDSEVVQEAAAAINIQIARDLSQFWDIDATVVFLPRPDKIPIGVWPVRLVHSLPPREGGFHLTRHNQPYAKVIAHPGDNGWTIDASHEILEMLVDPFGNRMQTGQAIAISREGTITDTDGQFSYLVEVCDPCEAASCAYSIQGIAVSDFLTPHFYDSAASFGTRYSFTGAIAAPRQVLPGGYVSYLNLATNKWQQIFWVDSGKPPTIRSLGSAAAKSLRLWIDSNVATYIEEKKVKREANTRLNDECRRRRASLADLAHSHAQLYI